MNLVILTGNLGAEIDVRTSGETTFAHFSVATNFRAFWLAFYSTVGEVRPFPANLCAGRQSPVAAPLT